MGDDNTQGGAEPCAASAGPRVELHRAVRAATSFGSGAARIVEALGLKNVRSMRLNMQADSVVAVTTEQFVSGEQLDGLAGELELREWVLVPKGEWDRANATTGWLDNTQDQERRDMSDDNTRDGAESRQGFVRPTTKGG
jgi:hypothetical protein